MDDYLNTFREMISLRGLTDHSIRSYSTYVRAYLDYLTNTLHKLPADVSWEELRNFIRWLQKEKNLSDRTMNACISQLRFFTIYVLHKPWDATQLPMRRFDTYLPYVPSQHEVWHFISTMPDLKQSPAGKFKGKYLAGLDSLSKNDSLTFSSSCGKLRNSYVWSEFRNALYGKDWCPYIKETFNGFGNAIEYLGRYTHKIAISNSRILSVDEQQVTFSARGKNRADRAGYSPWKIQSSSGVI